MDIFANHAHLFPKELNLKSPTSGSDGTLPDLLYYMDTLQIDNAIAFAPYPAMMDKLGINSNVWLAHEIKSEDRIRGFGIIDFRKPIDSITDQVENIINLGLIGLKVHPAVQNIDIVGKKAFEAYRLASVHGLPICFHTGVHWHRLTFDNPLLYDEVARSFPELVFCLEHVGGYNFFNEATAVIMNNLNGNDERIDSNIYAGLTSCFSKTDKCIFWYIGVDKFIDLLTLVGDDYIIFGLDFPHRTVKELRNYIRIIEENTKSRESAQKILGRNLLTFINKKRV